MEDGILRKVTAVEPFGLFDTIIRFRGQTDAGAEVPLRG